MRHERGHSHCRTFDKSCPYKHDDRDHKSHYRHDDRNHTSLPKREDKTFEGQPCHIHGPRSQYSYDKCSKNPKNQDKNSYDKKHSYKTHHNDKRKAIEDKESRASVDSPPASDSPASQLEDKEQCDKEQYHVQFDKNVKVGPRMAHVPPKRKSAKSIVSTKLKKKRPTFLDDNLDIGINFGNDPNDSVLLGVESLMAIDDVMNPFDFK